MVGIGAGHRLQADKYADTAGSGQQTDQLRVFCKAQIGLPTPTEAHAGHSLQDRPCPLRVSQDVVIQQDRQLAIEGAHLGQNILGVSVTKRAAKIGGHRAELAIVGAAPAGLQGLGGEILPAGKNVRA